ncbi:hypothetical protein HHI36_016726, partial [Cryptolaemus montrouzieri]
HLESVLNEKDINIAVITEHWLDDPLPGQVNLQSFIIGAHFSGRLAYGGALILVHEDHSTKNLPQVQTHTVEGVIQITG